LSINETQHGEPRWIKPISRETPSPLPLPRRSPPSHATPENLLSLCRPPTSCVAENSHTLSGLCWDLWRIPGSSGSQLCQSGELDAKGAQATPAGNIRPRHRPLPYVSLGLYRLRSFCYMSSASLLHPSWLKAITGNSVARQRYWCRPRREHVSKPKTNPFEMRIRNNCGGTFFAVGWERGRRRRGLGGISQAFALCCCGAPFIPPLHQVFAR
jgi:hypothetical protein